MFRHEPLLRADFASVHRFEHTARPAAVEVEPCVSYGLHFVESGEFTLGEQQLTAGSMFVSRVGFTHRYAHRDGAPLDVCLSVNVVCEFDAPQPVMPDGSRTAFLRWRLQRVLADGDSMRLDEWAADAVAALSDRNVATRPIESYAARIENVRRFIASEYGEPHTLASLASMANMSPFHFARIFRDLAGVPPHRYLLDVRLERADAMLRDGASVTNACFDSGFANLSHFIRSFRRRFRCAPHVRRLVVGVTSRKTT